MNVKIAKNSKKELNAQDLIEKSKTIIKNTYLNQASIGLRMIEAKQASMVYKLCKDLQCQTGHPTESKTVSEKMKRFMNKNDVRKAISNLIKDKYIKVHNLGNHDEEIEVVKFKSK